MIVLNQNGTTEGTEQAIQFYSRVLSGPEQVLIGLGILLLGLLIYFLFHLGNRKIPENARIKLGLKQIKLVFFIVVGLLIVLWAAANFDTLLRVLIPFIVAAVFSYIFAPVVNFLENKGVKRVLAVTIVFVVVFGLFALMSVTLFPLIGRELARLATELPERAQGWFNDLAQWYANVIGRGSVAPDTLNELLERFNIRMQSISEWFMESAGNILVRLSGVASSLVHVFTVPVVTFYFLKDSRRINKSMKLAVPPQSRDWVYPLAGRLNYVLGSFVRGQMLVALTIAVLSAIALLILGVEHWLVLGLIAGIGDLIPYIGPFLGAVPAVVFTMADDPIKALWVIGAFILIQQLEGNFISPKIVGDSVGLHPALIIFSLLLGGSLWGLVGLLIAVPFTGVLKVLFEEIFRWFTRNYPYIWKRKHKARDVIDVDADKDPEEVEG